MTAAAWAVVVVAASAQGAAPQSDVQDVLAAVRSALGGEPRLTEVATVSVEGRATRPRPDGTMATSPFEMYIELPDRFVRKDVVGQLGNAAINRRSGFNGADLISGVDRAMAAAGGRTVIGRGPGGAAAAPATPEARAAALVAARREHARLLLGMLGRGVESYPLAFAHGGTAEADGVRAHIVDVTAADGYAARLFVDAASGLPLMMSWIDRELPPQVQMTGGPGGGVRIGGAAQAPSPGAAVQAPSPEAIEQIREEFERRQAEAEASRRLVEYRLFYADYRTVDGIRMPARIQLTIDGHPAEELMLDRIRINRRIDAGTFSVSN